MPGGVKLRPSAAHRWMACPGSTVLECGLPDTPSVYADEGTAAHAIAAHVLDGWYASADHFIGTRWKVEPRSVQVDEDMARAINDYVAFVRGEAVGGVLFVEHAVSFGDTLGVPDEQAGGTADAVIIKGDELHIIDLKFGRGHAVDAKDNEQLMLYALGALHAFGDTADIQTVRLTIVQPRLGQPSSHTVSIDDLRDFAARAWRAARDVEEAQEASDITAFLDTGEAQCQWCKAKAICPALAKRVQEETGMDFDDLTAEPRSVYDLRPVSLSYALAAVDLIEAWCQAVRDEARRRLLDGKPVPGWKLVEGRKGARKWSDEAQAQAALEEAAGDAAWDRKLISPIAAEKLLKKTGAWSALAGLVTQPEGAPVVAPDKDKRPTWAPVAFESL